MTISGAEQLLIELVNRARLDPAGEAARQGIDLNQGLAAGTLTAAARQVLAPNLHLNDAAAAHARWMLETDTFSHTGAGGSTPSQRMVAAGYALTGSWTTGENLSWTGTTGTLDLAAAIVQQHDSLFRSPGHRTNLLNGAFREIGVAQVEGLFTSGGTTFNASMVTENFARSGTPVFLTGAAFDDRDGDRFYGLGEGLGGVRVTAGGQTVQSAAAGGYALALAPAGNVAVRIDAGGAVQTVTLDLSQGNVKLDALADGTLLTSGNATLAGGAKDAALLGVGNLRLFGNAADNVLVGNAGDNRLVGRAGNDSLSGDAGDDRLEGSKGRDTLDGAAGNDTLIGGSGPDVIGGGPGNDRIIGGAGTDTLAGGTGADTFVFARGAGSDVVTDFSLAEGDRIEIARGLHRGAGAADILAAARVDADALVLDFGAAAQIRLAGLSATDGLADALILL